LDGRGHDCSERCNSHLEVIYIFVMRGENDWNYWLWNGGESN